MAQSAMQAAYNLRDRHNVPMDHIEHRFGDFGTLRAQSVAKGVIRTTAQRARLVHSATSRFARDRPGP